MTKSVKTIMSYLLTIAIFFSCFVKSPDIITDILASEPNLENGVYQISNVDELLWAAENPDKNYVLTKDIDLSNIKDWTPIGSESKPFSGVFNGMGHTITIGIEQNKPSNEVHFVGLFGVVTGTVANLTVDGIINATIHGGYIGGIAANIAGGRIINTTSNVDITAHVTTSYANIGGIAGAIRSGYADGIIKNCINNGTINAKMPNLTNTGSGDVGNGARGTVGGIVGLICVGATGQISNTINNGDITVDNGQPNIGGIVGQTSSNNDNSRAIITYCANKGDITFLNSKGERAAGIIAYIKAGVINYSYNTGRIIAYTDNGSKVARLGYGSYFGIFGYANLGPNNKLEAKFNYNASPEALEAEICTVRNPEHGTFYNFYMEGRSEYETELNSNAKAGTPGITFKDGADLYAKITANEEGSKAYKYDANLNGGYPVLYFEKSTSFPDKGYSGDVVAEYLGNSLYDISYVFQAGKDIDATSLDVKATLYYASSIVSEETLKIYDSVTIGEITYSSPDGCTLYSLIMPSLLNGTWTKAEITAKLGDKVVFTKTLNSDELIEDVKIPFKGFPSYPEGTISKVYNAGPGMASDHHSTTDEDSYMVVISDTSVETFKNYMKLLTSFNVTVMHQFEVDGNIFYQLSDTEDPDANYYIYYTANSKQVRIIEDNSSNVFLTDLDTKPVGDGKTEFYLYSIDYTHGEGQTSGNEYWKIDCGALMVIKFADNSLFIIDGGHERQSSKTAMEAFLKFMYEITGQEEGSKINIKSWFFSHAHGDHVYFAHAFMDKYHDKLNLESVLFNFPSYQTLKGGYDGGTFLLKETLNKHFSDTKYVKLHTGQIFNLQGVKFEVLQTHEDFVTASGTSSIGNFNDTSTILKITIDGKTFMMLGDASNGTQDMLLKLYSEETLRSDAVQVAHHGYDDLKDLYAAIGAKLALFPNSEENAGAKSGNAHKYNNIINAAENVTPLFADPNTYKITVEEGKFVYKAIPSYRESFKTVEIPDLKENLLTDSRGIRADLDKVLKKESLLDYVIDRSIYGTPAFKNETSSLLLDGKTSTKFCTDNIPAVIVWTMKEPVTINSYVIYTANDNETRKGRNPQKWVIAGSNDGEEWVVLDSVIDANLPDKNFTGIAFDVTNPGSYQYYAFKVFANAGDKALQISELGLYRDKSDTVNPVQDVIDTIDALPNESEVTLQDEAAINNALNKYNALSDSEKSSVTNYNKLKTLLDKIKELKDQYAEDKDKEAAEKVIDEISKLPEIENLKLDDEDLVKLARSMYDKLTDSQKALVTNYDKLVEAEAKIASLKDEKPQDPKKPNDPNGDPKDPGTENPKTGDKVMFWVLILSTISMVTVFYKVRRKKRC